MVGPLNPSGHWLIAKDLELQKMPTFWSNPKTMLVVGLGGRVTHFKVVWACTHPFPGSSFDSWGESERAVHPHSFLCPLRSGSSLTSRSMSLDRGSGGPDANTVSGVVVPATVTAITTAKRPTLRYN